MKQRIAISVFVLGLWLFFTGCESRSEHENHQAMQHEHNSDDYLEEVVQPTTELVFSDQATVKPADNDDNVFLSVTGYVAVDERRNKEVASRVSGRIEKLYVRYNYQQVTKGEKIADLYSAELNTYLQEYLFVKKMSEDSVIVKGAREKLFLLGIRPDQLLKIETQNKTALTIEIISPADGFVLFSNSTNVKTIESAKPEMTAMGEASSVSEGAVVSEGRIREGDYVNQGQTLFYVNDLKAVWGMLAFTETQQKLIEKNLPVEIESELMSDPLSGKIDFIEPVFDNGQKFLQARVYLPNHNLRLKPESLLNAEVRSSRNRKMILPSTSVQHFGKHDIVWKKIRATKGGSVFMATVVSVGSESSGSIEILAGLEPTDEVARDAAYMMDSQSLLILK